MLIGFVADLHLDYKLGPRVDARGVNLRSADLEAALAQVVDGFIRANIDVAVFAGDVFDHPNPSERARQAVATAIWRLNEAGVKSLLMRGNHDARASLLDGTAIGTAATNVPDIIVADAFAIKTEIIGDVAFTLVPWMRSDADFLHAIEEVAPVPGKHNLLVLHCGLADLPEYAEMRPGSQTITSSLVPKGFDWIFSGHFHGFRTFPKLKFTFIGSPERKSVSELGQHEKGFLTYDSATRKIVHHVVATRPWYDLGILDASKWDAPTVLAELEGLRAGLPDWNEALVRVKLDAVRPEVYGALNMLAIAELKASAAYADIEIRTSNPIWREAAEGEDNAAQGNGRVLLEDLPAEWAGFTARLEGVDEAMRAKIERLGAAALGSGGQARAVAQAVEAELAETEG